MRKYQPIWEAIKAHPDLTASLASPISTHSTIIKAVRKEKDKDLSYKLVLAETGTKYRLMERIEGSLITFYLMDVSPINLLNL